MLNMIRGLHQDVFHMVIAAEKTDRGYILKVTPDDFANLRNDMYDELELKPRSRTMHSLLRVWVVAEAHAAVHVHAEARSIRFVNMPAYDIEGYMTYFAKASAINRSRQVS